MGLFDELEARGSNPTEDIPKMVLELVAKVCVICKIIGDAYIESDDGGDRWLEWRHPMNSRIWATAKPSTNSKGAAIWEVQAGSYGNSSQRFEVTVERKNF